MVLVILTSLDPGDSLDDPTAVILAVLNAALAPAVAYEYGKVPGSNGNPGKEPSKYVLVDVSRRYVDSFRGGGGPSVKSHRLGTRYVAKSGADARTMQKRITDALEGQIVATDVGEIGPFIFESSDAITLTDGFHVGTDTWTF